MVESEFGNFLTFFNILLVSHPEQEIHFRVLFSSYRGRMTLHLLTSGVKIMSFF